MNFANTEDEKEEFLKYADNLPSDTSDVNGSTDVYKSYLQVYICACACVISMGNWTSTSNILIFKYFMPCISFVI